MTLRALLAEVLLSFAARPWRAVNAVLMIAVLAAGAGVTEVYVTSRTQQVLDQAVRDGVNALVATAADGGLDAARCESLNGRSDVLAAGAIRTQDEVRFDVAPGVAFRRAFVTPHYLQVAAIGAVPGAQQHVMIGATIAEELGLAAEQATAIAGERVPLVGVLPPLTRAPEQDRWVFVPTPAFGAAAQCWFEAVPGQRAAVTALLPLLLDESSQIQVEVLEKDASGTTLREWQERPSRFGGGVAGLLAAAMLAVFASVRRSEYALYRLCGVGRIDAAVMISIEHIFLGACAVSLASLVVATVAVVSAPDSRSLVAGLFALMAVAALVSLASVVVGLWASGGDFLRHMKNRG